MNASTERLTIDYENVLNDEDSPPVLKEAAAHAIAAIEAFNTLAGIDADLPDQKKSGAQAGFAPYMATLSGRAVPPEAKTGYQDILRRVGENALSLWNYHYCKYCVQWCVNDNRNHNRHRCNYHWDWD